MVLQVLLQNGRLKAGHKQQPLRSRGESGGAFVVISGIVRVAGDGSDGLPFEDAFLGAGLPAIRLPFYMLPRASLTQIVGACRIHMSQ